MFAWPISLLREYPRIFGVLEDAKINRLSWAEWIVMIPGHTSKILLLNDSEARSRALAKWNFFAKNEKKKEALATVMKIDSPKATSYKPD